MNNCSLNLYYIVAICVLIRIGLYSINVFLKLYTWLKQKAIQLMADNGTKCDVHYNNRKQYDVVLYIV